MEDTKLEFLTCGEASAGPAGRVLSPSTFQSVENEHIETKHQRHVSGRRKFGRSVKSNLRKSWYQLAACFQYIKKYRHLRHFPYQLNRVTTQRHSTLIVLCRN